MASISKLRGKSRKKAVAATYYCANDGDEGGGGGGAPAWVESGFDIWIEPRVLDGYATGRAWNGSEEVAIDTLLGNDPSTIGWWGGDGGAYVEADLTTDGYPLNTDYTAVAFIGAARAALLAGSTVVIRLKNPQASGGTEFRLVNTDGSKGTGFQANQFLKNLKTLSASTAIADLSAVINAGTETDVNAIALTLTPTRYEISANGSEVVQATLTISDWPSGAGEFTAAFIACGDATVYVQSIGIITSPVADADLPALSALS